MARRVTNTTKAIGDSSLLGLAMLMGGGSNAIEGMEATGQREFVHADQIPTQVVGIGDEGMLSLGFKLGEPVPDDPMFRDATLPPGWKKRPTDHSMWSKIVDEKGRERFSVFYKAAFYDRRARMNVERRFGYSAYHDGSRDGMYAAVVTDAGKVIETIGERKSDDYEAGRRLGDACETWLDERYPDWQNPLAYWD